MNMDNRKSGIALFFQCAGEAIGSLPSLSLYFLALLELIKNGFQRFRITRGLMFT